MVEESLDTSPVQRKEQLVYCPPETKSQFKGCGILFAWIRGFFF